MNNSSPRRSIAALKWLILPAFLLLGIWIPVLVSNASQGGQTSNLSSVTSADETETVTATTTSTATITTTATITLTGTPLVTGTPTVTATGTVTGTEEAGKVTICHRTGSENNPYVEISVSVNALPAHQGHGDIIPAPAGGCSALATATTTPQATGSPTVTATTSATVTGTPVPTGTAEAKVTICHATGSASHPYSLITISVSGLNGHRHHAGDIIPAPAGGCPAALPIGNGSGGGNTGAGNGNGNGNGNGVGNGNGNGNSGGKGQGNSGGKGNGNGNGNGKGHK